MCLTFFLLDRELLLLTVAIRCAVSFSESIWTCHSTRILTLVLLRNPLFGQKGLLFTFEDVDDIKNNGKFRNSNNPFDLRKTIVGRSPPHSVCKG